MNILFIICFLLGVFSYPVKAEQSDSHEERDKIYAIMDLLGFSKHEQKILAEYSVYYSFFVVLPKRCTDEGVSLKYPLIPELKNNYEMIKKASNELMVNNAMKVGFETALDTSADQTLKSFKIMIIMDYLYNTENKLRMPRGTLTNISEEEMLKKYDHLYSDKDVCMFLDKIVDKDFLSVADK